jgi:outer membrane protein OmpA-like peptidoglycan-associated protein
MSWALAFAATAEARAFADTFVEARVEPGVAMLVGQPQTEHYRVVGGGLAVKVALGLTGSIAAHALIGAIGFPGQSNMDGGSAYLAGAGGRWTPFESRIGAPFLDASVGVAHTGDRNRLAFEITSGFDFAAGAAHIGPFAKYAHIVGYDAAAVDGSDAHILMLGVAFGFDTEQRAPTRTAAVVRAVKPPRAKPAPAPAPAEPEPELVDSDGDRIVDVVDDCVPEPETYNGVDDTDGCPDEASTRAYANVASSMIVIRDRVYFQTDSHKLSSRSHNVLGDVAAILKQYPQIHRIRIEGHTDDRGTEAYNQDLSERRAYSVMAYLIKIGIDPSRLDATGFGKSRPLVPSTTDEARDVNRRVNFMIVDLAEGTLAAGDVQ